MSRMIGVDVGGTFTDVALQDRSGEYTVVPNLANPSSVPGLATRLLNYDVDVSPTATLGPITLDAFIAGSDSVSGSKQRDPDVAVHQC